MYQAGQHVANHAAHHNERTGSRVKHYEGECRALSPLAGPLRDSRSLYISEPAQRIIKGSWRR